ncbi:MAG TPA: rhomboid family intramembrane serine protease [Chthoniobacterales bacterium]|nr:rhomboid family intramembrane serine protease [Chthoniobacterales bacterium]
MAKLDFGITVRNARDRMAWLDKMERRFGFLGIPGLPRILVGFAALVFGLSWALPGFTSVLLLDPEKIRHGEIWRLVTYIFIPQSLSPIWVIFALWFLWWVGEGTERAMGAFRFTLYFVAGMIGTTIAAFFFGANFSNAMLISSIFFAFARFYPEELIYILFILPVRIKWLAWIYGALLIYGFFTGSNSYRAALIAAFANYLIFFGPDIIHAARHRRGVSERRQRFDKDVRDVTSEPLHKCAVCGRTELTGPDLEFRVARDGEEYCLEHLPKPPAAV